MVKKSLLILVFIFLTNCISEKDKINQVSKTELTENINKVDKDYFQLRLSKNEIDSISLDVKNVGVYKDLVLKGIESLCGITTYNNIDSLYIDYSKEVDIMDYGKTMIFETKIFGDFAMSTPTNYFLFYNFQRVEIYLFPLDKIYFFKANIEQKQSFFGGVKTRRGIGFFNIFCFNGKDFSECLEEKIPIFLQNSECVQIENGYLKFENNDIDNNGLLYINFNGQINYYCNKNEFGININNRKPLKKDSINIKYFYDSNCKLWYCPNEDELKKKFTAGANVSK